MAISFIRTLILYALVIFALRVMGKRQVGELQPSELVVAIMISDLATIPMSDTAIPLASGVIPILTLIAAEIALSLCSLKSLTLRRILTGSPAVIIKNGNICREEMRKNRYNLEDLAEALRMKDFYDVSDVDTAILETNGTLSIIPKSEKSPLKAEDLNISKTQETLPVVLIADGKVYKNHMIKSGVDENRLRKILKDRKVKNIEDVFLLTIGSDNKITLQTKEKDD